MILVWCLAVALVGLSAWACAVDARERRIPNGCCAGVAACGVALQLVRASCRVMPLVGEPLSCAAVAMAVLVCGLGLELLYRHLSGHAGLGLGDVKFSAAWALTLGWLVVPGIAVASLLGALWALATRQRTFAFGPWLSLVFCCELLALCIF